MRGISPVVATILMVVIAITAAVVAYSWFTSVQGSLQAKASQRLSAVSSVTFTVPAVKCENNAEDNNNVYVEAVIANLSQAEPLSLETNKVYLALLDREGKVLDSTTTLKTNVTVDPQGMERVVFKFDTNSLQLCAEAYAVMVSIGSNSVVKPLR